MLSLDGVEESGEERRSYRRFYDASVELDELQESRRGGARTHKHTKTEGSLILGRRRTNVVNVLVDAGGGEAEQTRKQLKNKHARACSRAHTRARAQNCLDHLHEADVELPQFPCRAHLAPVKTHAHTHTE